MKPSTAPRASVRDHPYVRLVSHAAAEAMATLSGTTSGLAGVVEDERRALSAGLSERRARIERLRELLDVLERQAAADEERLQEIEGLLGVSPQMRIDHFDKRLRGQRLREVVVEVLAQRVGPDRAVHYKDWFEIVRDAGYEVAGKDPLATFLAQVSRAPRSRALAAAPGATGFAPSPRDQDSPPRCRGAVRPNPYRYVQLHVAT